jgi:hypothetical protein
MVVAQPLGSYQSRYLKLLDIFFGAILTQLSLDEFKILYRVGIDSFIAVAT